jgi:hypothetical protein
VSLQVDGRPLHPDSHCDNKQNSSAAAVCSTLTCGTELKSSVHNDSPNSDSGYDELPDNDHQEIAVSGTYETVC